MAEEPDPATTNEAKRRVDRIRASAVSQHDAQAGDFAHLYEEMAVDHFSSPFAYGRKKLDVLLDSTLSGLPAGSRILDIGCGTGEQVRHCRSLGFEVTGIEPSPRMRAIAKRINPGVDIRDGSITAIPFPDESFDFVMALEVLRYLDPTDIRRSYAEMLRVLKPGGQCFFTMVNRFALDGYYFFDHGKRLVWRLLGRKAPAHCEYVTPHEVRRDLTALGVREGALHGRMLAFLRLPYKINNRLGARIARSLESFDDRVSRRRWTVPLAGHLVVIARRPQPGS